MSAVSCMVAEPCDKRRMNNMDPDTKAVHLLLTEWGRYVRDLGVMGYPRQSVTEKAALYGKLGIPQEPLHRPEPPMPDRVAQVDAAVARLGEIDRKVITIYYSHWEAPGAMAGRAKMRLRMFQNVLRRARWRISGMLAHY